MIAPRNALSREARLLTQIVSAWLKQLLGFQTLYVISLDGSWHHLPSCKLHSNDPVLVDPASILDGFLQNQLSDVPGFSALLWSALLAKDYCSGHS